MALLKMSSVSAGYGGEPVLSEVSLGVDTARITALLGANGAGKTTIMRTLVGSLRCAKGTVHFLDKDITNWKPHRRVRFGMALVPEGRGILQSMTVQENLQMGADVHNEHDGQGGDSAPRFGFDRVYEFFPILADRRAMAAGLLSGGEQQMLAIGRALLSQPSVLMLDEPSLGLAPKITHQIFDLLTQLRDDGVTILLVEQNARMALEAADYGYVIEQGEIVTEGDAEVLKGDAAVQAAYLGG